MSRVVEAVIRELSMNLPSCSRDSHTIPNLGYAPRTPHQWASAGANGVSSAERDDEG